MTAAITSISEDGVPPLTDTLNFEIEKEPIEATFVTGSEIKGEYDKAVEKARNLYKNQPNKYTDEQSAIATLTGNTRLISMARLQYNAYREIYDSEANALADLLGDIKGNRLALYVLATNNKKELVAMRAVLIGDTKQNDPDNPGNTKEVTFATLSAAATSKKYRRKGIMGNHLLPFALNGLRDRVLQKYSGELALIPSKEEKSRVEEDLRHLAIMIDTEAELAKYRGKVLGAAINAGFQPNTKRAEGFLTEQYDVVYLQGEGRTLNIQYQLRKPVTNTIQTEGESVKVGCQSMEVVYVNVSEVDVQNIFEVFSGEASQKGLKLVRDSEGEKAIKVYGADGNIVKEFETFLLEQLKLKGITSDKIKKTTEASYVDVLTYEE